VADWRWQPVVQVLRAPRGVRLIHATRLIAELGDLARFANPRQLMGFLGMVPAERFLRAAATSRRHHQGRQRLGPPRVTPIIAKRQDRLPKAERDALRLQLEVQMGCDPCARDSAIGAQ
jgi:transposase